MRSTCCEEILDGSEPDAAFSEAASGHNLRLQLVMLVRKIGVLLSRFFFRGAPGTPIHWDREIAGESGELRSGRAENRATRDSPG